VDAVPVVFRVLPDQEAHPDDLVDQDHQELPVYPATQAVHQHLLANPLLHHRANLAPEDSQDHQAHLDHLETQVHPGSLGKVEVMLHQENLDQRDLQDHPASQDSQDRPENQEHPLNHRPHNQDLQVHQEMQVHPDSQEHPVNQAVMDSQDSQDPKDLQAHQVHPAMMALQDSQVQAVNLEVAARRASAPSTAPSMVVSSSRTVLAVVKHQHQCEPNSTNSIIQRLLTHCHIHIIIVMRWWMGSSKKNKGFI